MSNVMSEDKMQKTLVLLASQSGAISYDKLLAELRLTTVRELEDVLIRAITQEVIQGRLNPRKRRLEITDWASQKLGDDVDVDLEAMEQTLGEWIEHCKGVIKSLNDETEQSSQRLCANLALEKKVEDESEKLRKLVALVSGGSSKFPSENYGSTRLGGSQKNDAKRYKGASALRPRRN